LPDTPVQLDTEQFPQQGVALGCFDIAEEVLDARRLPRQPGGLEACADLVDPHVRAQREGVAPIRSLWSHVLSSGAAASPPQDHSPSVPATPHAGSFFSQCLRIRARRRSTVAREQSNSPAISSFLCPSSFRRAMARSCSSGSSPSSRPVSSA